VTRILARAGLLAGAWWLCIALFGAAPAVAATWQWPLPGRPAVVRGFTPPATPYGAGHRGVDLAGRPGLPVLAAGAGVVGYAGVLAGRGVVTVLHAGGLRTTYEPVRVSVHAGQRVERGAVLGRLAAGHAGCPAAACLHWGLLRGETYLDPLALVGAGRVRLLPLTGRRPPVGSAGVTGGPAPGRAAAGTAGYGPSTRGPLGFGPLRSGPRRPGRFRPIRPPAVSATVVPVLLLAALSAGLTSSSASGGRPWCAPGRSGSP
jgi:murein DD-endopeptidase MepM/ murein hydrolase activator NlpD